MKSITKNTLYLYCLTASNYLFGVITIPFITRVLGPEDYGNLGFAIALSIYFNLIIDFGFLLSGTKKIAESPNKNQELKSIFSAITYIKIAISILIFILLWGSSLFISEISENFNLLFLYLLSSLVYSVLPDYLYRGLEDMKMVTLRSVIARGIFTILLIAIFRRKDQILLIPTFNIIGGVISFCWVYYDLLKRYNVRFCRTTPRYAIKLIKDSSPYFLSRIASSFYNASNTVILGFLYPGQPVVGYYSSAEKFWSIMSQGCTPISDSYYPYMIRTHNYKQLFKVTIICEIPIIISCLILFYWAKPICSIVFGDDFSDAYIILRWILPIMVLILPTYMFGFPALTPIKLAKWANRSIVIAMVNQIIGLVLLYIIGKLNVISICILTFASQLQVFIVRLYFVFKGLKHSESASID